MNLTLRQFEILLAAADASTFSAAANRLRISQPALSEAVRRIERETGLTLFERTTRSLRLTEDGRRLAAVARELLRDYRQAMERIASAAQGGRLTIAALPSVACAALPRALADFSRAQPSVEIAVHDVQHERALAMVQDGVVDMAVTIKPAQVDGFTFESVIADTAHLVCRRGHPLARNKNVRWRDLADHPFIGITAISSVRRLTDAAFVQSNIMIKPRYEVEQVPCAVALVEAGLGVTALPSLTFAMFKGRDLVMRPLAEPSLRRSVGVLTRTGRRLPTFAEAFKLAIRDSLKRSLSERY
ncbi:MAG: LysR family transcriptional regulator [Pseudolabrys sp.]|nr:LysR family transcriptional regulator [Pseudolabrys sp.]MBV9260100.1 LysR family transcriptional regulator [Pseudolabrys sp.]